MMTGACKFCGKTLVPKATGRPPSFCSSGCRVRSHRAGAERALGVGVRPVSNVTGQDLAAGPRYTRPRFAEKYPGGDAACVSELVSPNGDTLPPGGEGPPCNETSPGLTTGRPRGAASSMKSAEPAIAPDSNCLEVGSDRYNFAWTLRPDLIARQLTPAQRLDPSANPYHPLANSWPPGQATTWARSNPKGDR